MVFKFNFVSLSDNLQEFYHALIFFPNPQNHDHHDTILIVVALLGLYRVMSTALLAPRDTA